MKRNREWTITYRVMTALRNRNKPLTLDELTSRTHARRASVYMALYHLQQHRCVTKRYHQWTGKPYWAARPEHMDTRIRVIEERRNGVRRTKVRSLRPQL